jgi:hypothetical protein
MNKIMASCKPSPAKFTSKTVYHGYNDRKDPPVRSGDKGSPNKHINKFMDANHQHNKNHDERPLHSHGPFKPKKKSSPAKKKGPCWSGYEMIGMKKKGGRTVPNCVPKKK